jgi:hypothetical protein
MTRSISLIATALAALAPMAVVAQTNDATYCKALADKYETYIAQSTSRTPPSADGKIAADQCKSGNYAAAIPVLEKKLNNARVELPPRS